MLVLERKNQEKVKIIVGDVSFEVTVLQMRNKIKLAFDAPKDKVQIWRSELLEEKTNV